MTANELDSCDGRGSYPLNDDDDLINYDPMVFAVVVSISDQALMRHALVLPRMVFAIQTN